MPFNILLNPYKTFSKPLNIFQCLRFCRRLAVLRVSGIRRINASATEKLRFTQQLTAISNRQRQHLSCIASMVTDAPIGHIMEILCRRRKFKDTEKVICSTHSVSVTILHSVCRY